MNYEKLSKRRQGLQCRWNCREIYRSCFIDSKDSSEFGKKEKKDGEQMKKTKTENYVMN